LLQKHAVTGPQQPNINKAMKALLIRLCRRPPLRLFPAQGVLQLPLLRSSRLRVAARLFLLVTLLYALELWFTGHRVAAPLVLLAACAAARAESGERPRCLVLAQDGRLFLHDARGAVEEMQLQPASLRLGLAPAAGIAWQ
jgi:hypothetical protein